MKTLFLGTPALAVPFLELAHKKTNILAVLTNPDQPAGRGYELKPSEVKQSAQKLSLPILQPETLKAPPVGDLLKKLAPDLGIVVAYGKLLPSDVLRIPKYGFLNVHFSLLPAYRGAAPIQWALINGERETGVTLFWLDEGMDTGPILMQRKLAIAREDNAETLRDKLVILGVEVLGMSLDALAAGKMIRQPQQGASSKAPILKKDDGKISWKDPAESIVNRIRGLTPWPGAFGMVQHGDQKVRLKILKAECITGDAPGPEGAVVRLDSGNGFVVKCGKDLLKITQVQPEGKRSMPAWDFWQGAHLKIGDRIE